MPGEASKNPPGSGGSSLLTFGDNGTEFLAVGPQDFYTIYNESPLLKASTPINGAGQTVNASSIIDVDVTFAPSGVPEPSSLFLLGVGLLSIVGAGLYRKRISCPSLS